MRILEYLSLGSEFNKNLHCKSKYQGLDKIDGFAETVVDKKPENSDLVYNNFNFNKFDINDEDFNELSDETKYMHHQNFLKIITELRKVNSITAGPKERKAIMNVPASKWWPDVRPKKWTQEKLQNIEVIELNDSLKHKTKLIKTINF